MLLVICASSLHFLLPIFFLLNVLQGDSSRYILLYTFITLSWYDFYFFFQLNMLQGDSSLGVRNDHSSTVKKPSLGNKSQMGKSGNQHRRPSGGPQPPQKVSRVKGSQMSGQVSCMHNND